MTRAILPQRRGSETFEIEFGGFNRIHTATVGFYEDGRPGEVFINSGKSGEQVEAIARDGAVLLSIALQHGAAIETIAHAITRDAQGRPTTVVGAVIDQLKNIAIATVDRAEQASGSADQKGPAA